MQQGCPVFPGLVRYDEVVEQKAILHAVRFTIVHSRARLRAARPPLCKQIQRSKSAANGNARALESLIRYPAGSRRLAKVILTALKKYGMIVADNGSDWFLSGAPDPRWNDDEVNTLKRVHGEDF